jgi:hypothetical protein
MNVIIRARPLAVVRANAFSTNWHNASPSESGKMWGQAQGKGVNMEETPLSRLAIHFADLEDPRQAGAGGPGFWTS